MTNRAPGIRLNKRTMTVQKANNRLEEFILQWAEEFDLTDVEILQALINCQLRTTKYMLRAERHPEDPDRKADEE